MAKAVSADAIRQNRVQVFVDGDEYFEASVEFLPPVYTTNPVRTARYGAVPIKHQNLGATCKLKLSFLESDDAAIAKFNEITAHQPLAIGADMPQHAIRIHDPANGATTTGDLYIPKGVFLSGGVWTDDGQGNRVLVVEVEGNYDATAGGAWKRYGI